MAADEVKTNEELNALFTQLADPFDPSEIKWRVTHTTRDGSRGAVIAFADPRAYTDRLNQLFTPTGWTRTYDVSTVSSVSRMKKDKLIQTGKVLVTCALTISELGCHAGSGEEWADEERDDRGGRPRHSNGPQAVLASAGISTTSPRYGSRSTNTVSQSSFQSSRSGRCPKRATQARAIPRLALALLLCNGAPSIRRRR
jgi:hypothetical protein